MSEQAHGTVTGTITDAVVDALAPGRDRVIWDRALTGFGVRVYPSGARVYVVQTRGPAGTKRATLGRHGVIGAGEARRRAAIAIARARAGEDPAQPRAQKPTGPALASLAERYLREHVAVRCKPSTAAQYRLAIERHILPALGHLPVAAIGRRDVADLQHTLRDRPAMANLVVATLARLIDQARAWGAPSEGTNPCRSAQKYRAGRRERFLTDAEFRRLGQALDALEATGRISPHAAAAIRLLMLTGCRRNEILTLRWEDVHLGARELHLARQQDRPAHDLPLARGGRRAGRHPPPAGTTPGSSPAPGPARGFPASSSPGRACAPAPASTTCASTTSATAMPPAPSPSARASPSSPSSSGTPRSRRPPDTHT